MRLAVIDCGTNTFNLLIVDFNNQKKYTKVFNSRIAVKLGQGSINKGFIGEEPFKRGIDAIKALYLETQKKKPPFIHGNLGDIQANVFKNALRRFHRRCARFI